MKKIAYIFSALFASTLFFGCSNMLELDPDGRVEIKDIFSTQYRTESYFSSCYNQTPQVGFAYDNNTTTMASFCDEAQDANDHKDGHISNWYKGATSADYNPLTATYIDPWGNSFIGIRKCNSFIKYISDPTIATYAFNAEQKAGWIAQARVLRAYYYLILIKRYGGVPIIDTPYEENHDYSADVRSTFEQCANFIISDCDAALATAIPVGSGFGFRWDGLRQGEMTRGVAWAIKSQVALYAASPLWYTPGSVYTWARTTQITKEALEQCTANGFDLFNVVPTDNNAQNAYALYFITRSDMGSNRIDKETILETTAWRSNVWRLAGVPINPSMEKAGPCPSQELIDSYETTDGEPILNLQTPYSDANHLTPNYNASNTAYDATDPYANRDPRFYASVYYNLAPRFLDNTATNLVETYVGGNCGISDKVIDVRYTRTGYYMRKFNNWRSGISNDAEGMMPIFRLGELYLNFAEAANNSVGPDVSVAAVSVGGAAMSALDAVNVVRARSQMPAIAAGLTPAAFELRYRNERRVELAFEEHRFFDVRRWKILAQTDKFVSAMKITNTLGVYSYQRMKLADRPTADTKYLMYPINQSEVNKMQQWTGTNWQNAGW